MIESGDILLVWNMPYPVGSQVIYTVSGGHCDHCAICLKVDGLMRVYEAQPPKVRWMLYDQYMDQCKEWSLKRTKWRERKNKPLYVERWRPRPINVAAALDFANSQLGVPYRMVVDYLWPGKKKWTQHCSKFAAMCLEKGGIVEWEKPYGKIEPLDLRQYLRFTTNDLQELIYP